MITPILAGYYEPDVHGRKAPESLCGSVKMWAHLSRQNITVAKCTVERLMKANGWEGVRRVKRVRTTRRPGSRPGAGPGPAAVPGAGAVPAARRGLHLCPDATGCFAYTAFVIDAYANRIVGWECSTSKETAFVESAIRQATALPAREGQPLNKVIQHSYAGSQYTSVHFGETLFLNSMLPSIGTAGDAFDNVLAETTIGLYKHECVRADSPFRRGPLDRLSDLEMITADWVHWYNSSRLMHHLGRIAPVEAEANY